MVTFFAHRGARLFLSKNIMLVFISSYDIEVKNHRIGCRYSRGLNTPINSREHFI